MQLCQVDCCRFIKKIWRASLDILQIPQYDALVAQNTTSVGYIVNRLSPRTTLMVYSSSNQGRWVLFGRIPRFGFWGCFWWLLVLPLVHVLRYVPPWLASISRNSMFLTILIYGPMFTWVLCITSLQHTYTHSC